MADIRGIAKLYILDIVTWQIANMVRPVNSDDVNVAGIEAGTLNERVATALTDNGFTGPFFIHFRLEQPPKLLVISPREKIAYLDRMLVKQDISGTEIEKLEMEIGEIGLSALIVELGGLAAAYPTVISTKLDTKQLIHAVVEEWAHQYLAFRPLGFLYLLDSLGIQQDPDMITMNETLAGMMADEIAGKIYEQHYRKVDKALGLLEDAAFNFDTEMRKTRIEVDRLLGQGKIIEAEQYMEKRRLTFNEHGYAIRKLNQAYFAFHGIYGQDPVSVSPVYRDLQNKRQNYASLADFVGNVSSMTSYAQLRAAVH